MSQELENVESVTVDTVQLISMAIVHYPAEKRHIMATFSEGYTAQDGGFVPVRGKQLQIATEAVNAAIDAHCSYDDLRNLCYSELAKAQRQPAH